MNQWGNNMTQIPNQRGSNRQRHAQTKTNNTAQKRKTEETFMTKQVSTSASKFLCYLEDMTGASCLPNVVFI